MLSRNTHRGWIPGLVAVLLTSACLSPIALADVYVNHSSISLSWAANPEPDVQGYEVHRSSSYSGPYSKAHSGVLSATSWTDTSVTNGGRYYYKLRTADVSGNFSDLSAASDAAVVDLTSPTVMASPAGGTYGQSVLVTLSASESSTIYYTTNGSVPTQSSPVYSSPISITGSLTLRFFAIDQATNQSAIMSSQYTIITSDGDFDDDGYPDSLEEAMGTDPYSSASVPVVAGLVLSPSQTTLKPGTSSQLSVSGVFTPSIGNPIEMDMSCLVRYDSQPVGVASCSACGNVSGQSEGSANVLAQQIANGVAVATSNSVAVTVDGSAPYVDPIETHPYDGQGTNNDVGPTPRIPSDTGVVIRVLDDIGIDAGSIQLAVNGASVPAAVREVDPGDSREIDVAYRNLSGFAFDAVVTVGLTLSDLAGNPLNYTETFRIESAADHQWAVQHRPIQISSGPQGGAYELTVIPASDSVNDELLEGAKIRYRSGEPVVPRFGPVDEIPALDIAAPVGIPINLEPANVFDNPVTVKLPLPGVELVDSDQNGVPDSGLEAYQIYQYVAEPTVLWRNAVDSNGWMVEGSRVDHYETTPPTIEIQVNASGGIQVGYECLPPYADFIAAITKGEIGQSIPFFDSSAGTITQWQWNFGDGATSAEPNPVHVYTSIGIYTVTLTVSGLCGTDSIQKTNYVMACDNMHLVTPGNGLKLYKRPYMSWTIACNTIFQIEVARDANFTSMLYVSPALRTPPYPPFAMPLKTWNSLPKKQWLYWRVKGWTDAIPVDIHTSAEVAIFMKMK
ncbi:chitobiase/beta-hexosaminidase C-terminal domain-containing protein [Candidatus Poribacteria bacterium]|nr:chitobiase/beta-hexosaminidase C-terminal domain-containing protein [Candidatus Poribacteria bacterium]